MKQTCKHEYWSYPHGTIQGKRNGWLCIVRVCDDCGLKQAAHIEPKVWVKATGDYARDEHYR